MKGRHAQWTADALVNVTARVSRRFHEAWKASGKSFGEFCEALLGDGLGHMTELDLEVKLKMALNEYDQLRRRRDTEIKLKKQEIEELKELKQQHDADIVKQSGMSWDEFHKKAADPFGITKKDRPTEAEE